VAAAPAVSGSGSGSGGGGDRDGSTMRLLLPVKPSEAKTPTERRIDRLPNSLSAIGKTDDELMVRCWVFGKESCARGVL
jgi:hypothetical protein